MPVPKSLTTNAPRTLLRDVVYNQMLAAIEDGTLTPGERLNDVELTEWLGVSRTPVREAISRLESEGLVEMAANRYTRVASASTDAFRDAVELADALYSHALVQAGRVSDASSRDLAARASNLQDRVKAKEVEAYRELQDVLGALVESLGNSLLTATEHAVRGRVKFHVQAAEADIDWGTAAVRLEALGALSSN